MKPDGLVTERGAKTCQVLNCIATGKRSSAVMNARYE
jgi:hypothetical protein